MLLKIFKWGPIDGRLIYPDFFNVAFTKFGKHFYSWPNLLGLFYQEKMVFIADYAQLRESGKRNFKKFILNNKNFKKYYKQWRGNLNTILDIQKNISPLFLKKLTNTQLKTEYKNWSERYIKFWTIGELPEVANWGGEVILKQKLEKLVPAKDFIKVFERLSAPENLSFYQKAELDLLKLKKIVKDKKIFEKKLEQYQQNYFWILNSYHHTRILTKAYFRKELSSYSLKKANQRLRELNALPQKTKKEKEKIIKKYRLGRDVAKIAKRLSFCIWWQDIRKYYIFLANHYIDLFLKEFSRRYKIKFNDLKNYNYFEILALLEKGKVISQKEINKRYNNTIVYYIEKSNSLKYFSGQTAKKVIDKYLKVRVSEKIKEFKGLVVSRGKKVKASVKIITTPKNIKKMNKGDILVAAMTSPDYILAIKKASAIVTDEGGMTSHAAIVSRELGIPCIVGTKIATKVLNDGEMIEVDANKGIIRKI